MPCSPSEIEELANLLGHGKLGESSVRIGETSIIEPAPNAPAAVTRQRLGAFMRPMRGVFGPDFTVEVLNPLTLQLNKIAEFETRYYGRFLDAFGLKGWKRIMGAPSREVDERVALALENLDRNGNWTGAPLSIPPNEVQIARNLRVIYNDLFKEIGLADPDQYIQGYRRLIRERGGKGGVLSDEELPLTATFRGHLNLENVKFYAEMERTGVPQNWDPTASAGFIDYVRGAARAKMLKPFIQTIENEKVFPMFGAELYRGKDGVLGTRAQDAVALRTWMKFRDHLFGVPTDLDERLVASMNRMAVTFDRSPTWEVKDLYKISQGLTNLFYGGVLGFRPGSAIRQLFQIVPGVAELGAKYTMLGMSDALGMIGNPAVYQDFVRRGIVTPALEGIHDQLTLAKSVGRAIHGVTEASMKLFDYTDRFIRIGVARGADRRFDDAVAHGIETLRARRELKEQIVSLVKQGRVEEARDLHALDIVGSTQFIYGKGNRPEMFRGVVGNAAGVLMSYPLNLVDMYAQFGQRAYRAYRGTDPMTEALPLLRQVAAVLGIMLGGAKLLGTDLSSNFLSLPGAPPIVQNAVNLGNFLSTNGRWLWGSTFLLGETDYQAKLRADANREFVRSATNFIPGGLMAKEVYRIVDEPTFNNYMRLFGFPPLPAETNIEVRAKATERRREQAQEKRIGLSD